jgi:hypothetical protein
MVNERCYAKSLGDCSSKISLEHYISKSVLLEIARGGNLMLEGAKKTPQTWLPPKVYQARILCSYHNRALSELDAEAQHVIATLRAFQTALDNPTSSQVSDAMFSGPLFERWLLKVALGLLASGQIRPADSHNSQITLRDHERMIRVLFGKEAWPDQWGMYLFLSPSTPFHAPEGQDGKMGEFGTQPLWHAAELWLMKYWVRSLPFALCFGKPDALNPNLYRPGILLLANRNGASLRLHFQWTDKRRHFEIPIQRIGTRPK